MAAEITYTTDELFELAEMLDEKHHLNTKWNTLQTFKEKMFESLNPKHGIRSVRRGINVFLRKSYGGPFWGIHRRQMLTDPLKSMAVHMNDQGDSSVIAKWRLKLGR